MPREKLTEEQKAQKKLEREAKREEERIAACLKHSLESARNVFCDRNPTYFFNVGDEVQLGAITKTVILEKLDDGKVYRVQKTMAPGPHSREKETKIEEDYVHWTGLRTKEGLSKERHSKDDKFFLQYMQQSIDSLIHKSYHFGVDMDPEYQREHVWDIDDKVSLIDSIMNNHDIGKFLFNRRSYSSKGEMFEIVDGKQRLTALLEFYEDRFAYKGLFFSQLSLRDQNHFEGYRVNVAEVNELPREELIELFLKVNTGGRIMSKEHLDNVRKLLKK